MSELIALAMFFVGISVDSLNKGESPLGWIVPMTIATIFTILDFIVDSKRRKG